ncbi:uncharacterized protein [Ambystoma mexicanum]|uniref:uncharacterized protein n=1 Tax=Ambystoma mexicanum TaxID=8296 RepID=UPI0037E721F7
MAESGFSSANESDEEIGLDVLSGFVPTVYRSFKEKMHPNRSNSLSASATMKELPETEGFYMVVSRAASSLNLDAAPFEPLKSKHMSAVPSTDRVLLSLDESIVKQCKFVWEKPASATPVHKAMDRKYRVPKESLIHCFSHPPADSAVVKAVSGGRTSSAAECPLTDTESKVMDSIGKRAYHSGGLGLRQANIALVLARYNKQLWSQVPDAFGSLPEDLKNKALEIQKEALAAADVGLEIARDQADVAARVMAAGIVLRRRAWLRETKFPYAFQSLLVDQPFDGVNLFSTTTEELIKNRKSPAAVTAAKTNGVKQVAETKSPSASTTPAVTSPRVAAEKSATRSPGTFAPKRKRRRRNNKPDQE